MKVMCSFTQENRTTEEKYLLENLRGEKCELFCSCTDFRKLDNIYCVSPKEVRYLSSSDYDDYDIFVLSFTDSKSNYILTKKMLQGLKIRSLILNDPDSTVAENSLDGVTGLYALDVGQSSIEVISLVILIFIDCFFFTCARYTHVQFYLKNMPENIVYRMCVVFLITTL